MERVLVTGAGGYVGCILVDELVAAGYAVRALDRFFFGRELLPADGPVEVVQEDARCVSARHFAGVDHVIDLVALSNDPSGEVFERSTWEINHASRVATAHLARQMGVKRYVLPSSCSVYGYQAPGRVADEASEVNPLTTYARANHCAEQGIVPLASPAFCPVILRQATVYGYSPRMRFDLAINGMTHGAWSNGVLPLLRDGSQWRPMIHVQDTARAMILMLTAPEQSVKGEVFNVGSERNNYQLGDLAERVAAAVPRDVRIEWYGEPDDRSYRVSFEKIEALGYQAAWDAQDGVKEICQALSDGRVAKTSRTMTIQWYQELADWHALIKETEMYGGMIDM